MSGKPTVLLLGVFHMENPGKDKVNIEFDDVLSPWRQEEIRESVELLKNACPTKVAVEQVFDRDDDLNEEYKQYRAGTLKLSRNEIHQLGFRIASELNHDKIYAVDWMNVDGIQYKPEFVDEWTEKNQPELYEALEKQVQSIVSESNDSNIKSRSIREMLGCNLEDARRVHQYYLNSARIGQGNDYIGMDWVMWWYRRNMTIYVHITRLATSPDDRILVMVGNGHIYLLNQFFQESGLFNVELADKYLR